MAISGNRSPSPNPSSRPNSNSRNSEANSPMRRSFSGNPFLRHSIQTNPRGCFIPATPANSPADFPRRSCIGKEEKENEKDQGVKFAKARSPAVSKSTKNFMVPTISAASKINPSPRKKVLTDRNEQFRTSFSFSDGKSPFNSMNMSVHAEDFDPKLDMELKDSEIADSQCNEDEYETPFKSNSSQKDSSFNSQVLPLCSPIFVESSDLKKPFASSISPSIAPLDADPSIPPPYDPKTNYLSPRPQFLHYKPNPRLEPYLQKQQVSGTKNLEDCFLVESFSDSEVTEESESENSQKDSEDTSSNEVANEPSEFENSQRDEVIDEASKLKSDSPVEVIDEASELKSAFPVEVVNGISESENSMKEESEHALPNDEVETKDYEPEANTTPFNPHSSMESVEAKRETKSRIFTRTKFFSLLLVLLIACSSVLITNSPVFENLSNSELYEESYNGLARNFKLWTVYSKSFVNQLMSSFSQADKLGPIKFSNLTYEVEDPFFNEKQRYGAIYEVEPVLEDEDEDEDEAELLLAQNIEKIVESERALGEEGIKEGTKFDQNNVFLNQDEMVVKTKGDDHFISDPDTESTQEVISFDNIFEMGTSVSVVQLSEQIDPENDSIRAEDEAMRRDDDPKIDSNAPDLNIESTSVSDPEFNSELSVNEGINYPISDSESEPTAADPNPENALEMSSSSFDLIPEAKFFEHYKLLAISLLALALMAAAPVLIIYLKKANSKNPTVLIDSMSENITMKSIPSPQIYSPEVDLNAESCPSEMSSFGGSFSYSKGGMWGATNEAQSQERRKQRRFSKRESLASSDFSMSGSPSYGSFTTYERLPSKHGYGDEEVVTPVRRSSRIKKQVTST